jgi:uncharacterized membrane protein
MKRYAPNQQVPMKFHNLYVYLLNPIGILIRAGIAGLVLLMLLGKTVIPASYQPFDDIAARYGNGALWVVFAFAAFAFLFALWAEVLLAKRRPLGVLILVFDYLLNLANACWAAWNDRSLENIIIAAVTLLISILVCVYYWKRSRLFRHR